MQFQRLTLNNWGPYRGANAVNLAVTPTAPIVLIHGENMRGKTSLLRAIKWCLYGQLFLQDGTTRLDPLRMVNNSAIAEGVAEYGVELVLEHEGEVFTLERSASASVDEFGDRKSTLVKSTLITAGGHVYPEQHIHDVIEQMLDESISDFFLFDGEMLIRFDERLREDVQSKKAFIRTQVERALGLPFLKGLANDLVALHGSVSDELTKGNRADERARKLQNDIAETDAQLEIFRADVTQIAEDQQQIRDKIEQLDSTMRGVAEIRDSYFKREALIEQKTGVERRIRNLVDESADFSESTWWFPLAAKFAEDLEGTVDRLGQAAEDAQAASRIQFELESIQSQQHSAECLHCGQLLPPGVQGELATKEAALAKQLAELPDQDVGALHARITTLNRFKGASGVPAQFRQLSQAVGRERLELHRVTTQITELSEALADNSLDIRALEAELDQKRRELASSSAKLEHNESQIGVLRQRRLSLVNDLGKQQGTSPLLGRRVEIYGEAVRTAEESLDTFRLRMRERVQENASSIFRQLTTEPDFAGIRLKEDYSLAVLHSDGTPVDLISAGGNQVLTMSFIGALGSSAAGEAPLVMDTPLGRLDMGHRHKILAWLTTFSTQVILFVQSGEFEAQRDRPMLGTSVGRELVIERGESAEDSRISEATK